MYVAQPPHLHLDSSRLSCATTSSPSAPSKVILSCLQHHLSRSHSAALDTRMNSLSASKQSDTTLASLTRHTFGLPKPEPPSPPRRASSMSHTLGASTSPRMSSAHLTSPNAIPPRTSSTGGLSQAPTKPVLQPLPESSWLSNRHTSVSTITPSSGLATSTSSNGPAPDPLPYTATTWSPAKESILLGPYTYLFSHPGKDIRAQLIGAFNAWLSVPPAALEIITRVVGMLHTASLLVDDVEDSSVLRRGLPVAHSIFGTAQTINSANYVYFEALQELLKLDELEEGAEGVSGRRRGEAVRIYTEELVNLHRGQGMDLFWRDTLTVPSEDDYLEMVGNKTGGLFRLAVRLMQAESASDRDCVPLVSLIGTIYQIRDDYLNLLSPSYSTNKGLCEDLTEGKFSFPIIHALRADPTNLVLLNILKQKTTDDEVKRYAVGYMQARGSFGYCKEVVERLVGRARTLVKELDRGEGRAEGVERILGGLGIE